MKILLLGGSGFIGQHIAQSICAEHEIVVADRMRPAVPVDTLNIEFKQIDFIKDDFTPLLDGVGVVFHLISTTFPADGTDSICDEIKENVLPTIRLLDTMVDQKTPRIIYFSTGGIIYGQGDGFPLKESDILRPICKYGAHKLAIEKYIHLYNIYHGMEYCVVRPSNPYSCKTFENRPQGIIPIIINKIMKNEVIKIWGDGSTKRDYIHISDVMSALRAILDYSGPQKVFNIGTGISTSINAVISLATQVVNDDTKLNRIPVIEYMPARVCDVTDNKLDASLLQNCTGWSPEISLIDGIRMCVSGMKV